MRTLHASERGQSLIELVIGIAIGIIFIVGSLGIITLALRLDFENKFSQDAGEIAQSLTEEVRTIANANWRLIDELAHGSTTLYHVTSTEEFLTVLPGSSTIVANGENYSVYFTMENLERDGSGRLVDEGEGTVDPSTLKITATAEWANGQSSGEVQFASIVTRDRDRQFAQTDWSGGVAGSPENSVTDPKNLFATSTSITFNVPGEIFITSLATTTPTGPYSNIDQVFRYAWNDVIGWIDFRDSNNVHVSSTEITGFATSSVGYIALNCDSVPPAPGMDVCPPNGPSQFGVTNDGSGNLGGMAWNDTLGWISFSSTTPPAFGVTIDGSGDFHGFAWSDTVGWISFNCLEAGACGTSNYKVKTTTGVPVQGTLTSLIFDTSESDGVAPNTIVWQGLQPTGTTVQFQIATDCIDENDTAPNCTGGASGWDFVGPDGTSGDYYEGNRDISLQIPRDSAHYNKRYLRYKVYLLSDTDRIVTPTITDIALTWSL